MLHIEKNILLLLQFAKKLQVDIFKITPTGRDQKQDNKKNKNLYVVFEFENNLSLSKVVKKNTAAILVTIVSHSQIFKSFTYKI